MGLAFRTYIYELEPVAGARHQDLIPSLQCIDDTLPPLPEVAVVFVSVADQYVIHSRLGRRKVHQLSGAIARCMLEQLDALPTGDGYLCRQMETELKYMLVFQQPEAALQWFLLVQICAGYLGDSVTNASKRRMPTQDLVGGRLWCPGKCLCHHICLMSRMAIPCCVCLIVFT